MRKKNYETMRFTEYRTLFRLAAADATNGARAILRPYKHFLYGMMYGQKVTSQESEEAAPLGPQLGPVSRGTLLVRLDPVRLPLGYLAIRCLTFLN